MMPSRSSAVPGDTPKTENPTPLLGVAGQAGSVGPDEATGSKEESHPTTHSTTTAPEGVHQKEQYCILVRIKTARDKKPLQSYAWVEGLLNDFFRATIGVPQTVLIISPTECMIFTPGHSKDLGMSYEDSLAYCQSLNGIHPWVGSTVEVTAFQRKVKEGQYDVTRAKQFTHE